MRSWSKCLIWFAVLILPLQAVQGTDSFCHCEQNSTTSHCTCEQTSYCRCIQEHDHVAHECSNDSKLNSRHYALHKHVNQQQECPSDCFCRRLPESPWNTDSPAKKLHKPTVQTSAMSNRVTHSRITIFGDTYLSVSPSISSQQLCISLCKFTL